MYRLRLHGLIVYHRYPASISEGYIHQEPAKLKEFVRKFIAVWRGHGLVVLPEGGLLACKTKDLVTEQRATSCLLLWVHYVDSTWPTCWSSQESLQANILDLHEPITLYTHLA